MKRSIAILATLCLIAPGVRAFDVSTHALLTYKAWQRLILEKPDTLDQLGLVDKPDAFRTETYLDLSGTNVANRVADRDEQQIIGQVGRAYGRRHDG